MQPARMRWIVAGGVAVVVLLAMLSLFRLPRGTSAPPALAAPAPAPIKPLVQLRDTSTDTALKEEAEIRDLRPLFLPTDFNVALPEPRREPGRTFLDNETVKWRYSESELTLARELPPIVTLSGKPAAEVKSVDALEMERASPVALGMGRNPVALTASPGGGGRLEVVATASGTNVLSERLPDDAQPAGSKPWEPLELIAMVDATGLAAPLTVTSSSRVEEIDAHYRNYLARSYRIGERLPPGFYRLVVAP